MTESKTTRPATPKARRPRAEAAQAPTERPERPVERRCNVPGCDATPEFRGLCPAHRQTHRGLLDPKEA